MIETIYADIGYASLTKDGQMICGDHVEKVQCEDGSIVAVLADGLGSGVKACILSTLTATIISRMIAENLPIANCVNAVAEALPVCSVRHLAYSTFTVLHISTSGMLSIFQYDNPSTILLRDGAEVEIPFSSTVINDKTIESAKIQLQKDDVVIAISDGVENAGVAFGGASYENKWGRAAIVDYMEPFSVVGFSAKTINTILLDECFKRYVAEPGDDTTALTLCIKEREQVNVLVGPPANVADTHKMMSLFFSKKGRHVVCGGTTAKIAADYLGTKIVDDPYIQNDPDIPAMGKIEGVDLTTEGVLTLSRVLEYAEDYLQDNRTYVQWCYSRDSASLMARMLFEEATDINIFVGSAVNPAHQGAEKSISFATKMKIINDLKDRLEDMGKQVRSTYF